MATMISLHWYTYPAQKHQRPVQELFVGTWDEALVTLRKREKLWEAVSWVPGLQPAKRYDTLERQKEWAEHHVRRIVGLILTEGEPFPEAETVKAEH